MQDIIHDLYQREIYPPMSHPLSDPAVSGAMAYLRGLPVVAPRGARILEIGCCSGHHLIPLAIRWPESQFTGIDLAERSIEVAEARAAAAGVKNIRFLAADLRSFEPGESYDYIIAHGFWSWVPDEVKEALLLFLQRHLSPNGIATVSFNVEAGWKSRLPVIAKARAIQQAGDVDLMTALHLLKSVLEDGDPERLIADDMLEKGPAILDFDDFGPINHPYALGRFVDAAHAAGLRWLGSSDPAEEPGLEVSNAPIAIHFPTLKEANDSDLVSQRTFRSEILCRADAQVESPQVDIASLALRRGSGKVSPEVDPIYQMVGAICLSVPIIEQRLNAPDGEGLKLTMLEGLASKALSPRLEAVEFSAEPPAFPRLDRFRLFCANEKLPLVDAWHKPCAFPGEHYQVLAAMDSSRSIQELASFASERCPDLNFHPWLSHLASRGMFA